QPITPCDSGIPNPAVVFPFTMTMPPPSPVSYSRPMADGSLQAGKTAACESGIRRLCRPTMQRRPDRCNRINSVHPRQGYAAAGPAQIVQINLFRSPKQSVTPQGPAALPPPPPYTPPQLSARLAEVIFPLHSRTGQQSAYHL